MASVVHTLLLQTPTRVTCHFDSLQALMPPTREELEAVERVTPAQLAAELESLDTPRPLIIDVRDEDFMLKGHICGAEHLPKENFQLDEDVDALVRKFQPKFSEIVFHCVRSNTRGPTCALRFIERLDALENALGNTKPHVRVLAGGFAAFAEVS